jgi:hypothetical protein
MICTLILPAVLVALVLYRALLLAAGLMLLQQHAANSSTDTTHALLLVVRLLLATRLGKALHIFWGLQGTGVVLAANCSPGAVKVGR